MSKSLEAADLLGKCLQFLHFHSYSVDPTGVVRLCSADFCV